MLSTGTAMLFVRTLYNKKDMLRLYAKGAKACFSCIVIVPSIGLDVSSIKPGKNHVFFDLLTRSKTELIENKLILN